MSLENFKASMTTLVIVALILGAFALALDAFQDDMDTSLACANASAYYNASSGKCCIAAGFCSGINDTRYGTTAAYNSTSEGLEGVGNATSYLSTIGTLIGVAALIAIVMAAFYFARR